jgi:uncharacterized membrane protein YczE/cytidylate kinase
MQQVTRSREEWVRRYASFVVILFVIAFGTSLSIRANLGSSPISAPPYVLSLRPGAGLTFGQLTICMHVFFITAQVLLLRKDFERRQLAQILVSFLFGFYTDLTMWLTGYLQVPLTLNPLVGYPLRLVELLLGGGILAFGIACEVRCDSLMLAGEGFPLAISRFLNKDFGRVKMCTDTMLVSIAVVFMFVFFGHWDWKMVGIGTLVSMFYVGFMVRVFAPHISWLDVVFIPRSKRQAAGAAPAAAPAAAAPLVITIARQYGSGGRQVGELLAQRLGIAFYDSKIIEETAARLGYTTEQVADTEQNISTAKLWELIFTGNSIPPSMNPSRDDAIFVDQSRLIRDLAHRESCVIMGRCANWILRDDAHAFRIFITSDPDFAIDNVMAYDHLTHDDALHKLTAVNRGRANHYFEYTGQRWTDAGGYDMVLNTSRLGVAGAVEVIAAAVRAY